MTSTNKGRLFLVDGSAVFYRAHFAFIRNPLINSKGENTSATFGFVNSLLKIIREEDPDYLAVAFDTKPPTFRHQVYPEYKSTRAKMPSDLVEQLPRIHQAVDVLNIPYYELEGFEADDIIGTMAKSAVRQGVEVWCVTGDKDYFQLVEEDIKIYNPQAGGKKPEKMGPREVQRKFGVPPELVVDKLALMGDNSDNVPGVPGIGPKTADRLLKQFGSLDNVLSGYKNVTAKGTRDKIAAHVDSARLSRELVIIRTDTPIAFELADLKRRSINYQATKELFLELEFTRLLKELLPDEEVRPSARDARPGEVSYTAVTSMKELEALIKRLSSAKEIAVDTETTSLNSLAAEIVGVSLSDGAGRGYYVPLGHTTDSERNLPRQKALGAIRMLLEDTRVQKIGQNIKYDLEVLHRYGIDVDPVSFDTMVASYVLDPSGRQHSLDLLALKYFDHRMQPISDLIGSGSRQRTFDTVPVEAAAFYSAEDADFTFRLRSVLAPLVHENELQDLYYNIELPLIKVLTDLEETGIRVDIPYLQELAGHMERKLANVESDIYAIAGGRFNIKSTRQLSHVLFDKLNLPTKGKTAKKTGYSTDVRVLEELAKIHDLPRLVLDYRQLAKLINTYVDALPKLVNVQTGRVHTSFNQTVTATGRLSSTDPNLQNIPVRTEEGREIRRAFVPRDRDHLLVVADYSQIELRILAHYADDQGLIEAFKKGEDIHARTAAEVYGVSLNDVTPEMRRDAKTANFAVIYGVTAYGLAQQTEMDLEAAKEFIRTYFERYPGIRDYMESTKQLARDNGYVTTLFNRRRYIPEINDRNVNVRQFAERTAINTPIQGTAADMIKVAMIKIHRKLAQKRSKMVLQVHDELVFDVHKSEVDEIKQIAKQGMEKAVRLKVPIVVDLGVGDNWLDAK